MRDCVVNYLEDDSPEIRRAAALTCCQILAGDPIVAQTSNHAIKLVNEVLEKLLTLAIADPGMSYFFLRRVMGMELMRDRSVDPGSDHFASRLSIRSTSRSSRVCSFALYRAE